MDQKTLGIFFTKNVSLKLWDDIGILNRELKFIKALPEKTGIKKVVLFSYGGKEDLKYKKLLPGNIELVINKLRLSGFCYALLMPFLHYKKIKKLDIVRTIQFRGFIPALTAKILLSKKMILRCGFPRARGLKRTGRYFRYVIYKAAESVVFRLADVVVLTDAGAKKCIQESYGTVDNKIFLIPNYIDADLFYPSDKIEKNENEVCFAGRLSPVKNLHNLIDGVNIFNGKLKIIGTGKMEEELKKYAREKGAEVNFMGRVDNEKLPEELRKSEYFALSSFSEGQPKALLEAMACGLPVIGTDVPGIKTIIKDGVNGILCGTDSKSIAHALNKLKLNAGLKDKIACNARKYVKENYSLEKVMKLEKNEKLLG